MDPIDHELNRMADNPGVAAMIKEDLEKLSKGAAGPGFAEMARELLEGRTSLRAVGQSSAYAGQFAAAAEKFRLWYAELDPQERAELNQEVRKHLGEGGQ